MISIISLIILTITLATRSMIADAISSELAAFLTMAGGAIVMNAAWQIYSTPSPFGPIWYAILAAGTLGLLGWNASDILLDVHDLPAAISLVQITFLYGIVPITVSVAPILRWIWDYRNNESME